jgi:hypothetical protein
MTEKVERKGMLIRVFGGVLDAFAELGHGSTVLDPSDTALVVTERGNIQLFVPKGFVMDDTGLALVEIYNALCRDRAGVVNHKGEPLPENEPYQGFTENLVKTIKFNHEK